MTVKRMNDAPILDQLDGQWEKLFAVALRKLGGKVTLTAKDFEDFSREYAAGTGGFLLTFAHKDSIDFKILSEAAAKRMAEHHEQTGKGTA